MSENKLPTSQQVRKKAGRPVREPGEGRRVTLHISVKPSTVAILDRIRNRPIAAISQSEAIEDLIISYDVVEQEIGRFNES
jgi:hypothetical protein